MPPQVGWHDGGVRAVVQRVQWARVLVAGEVVGAVERPGLLVLVGVTHTDTPDTAHKLAEKVHNLRVLRGESSCAQTGAPLLVVSQFTLYGDTRKGRRPSWDAAAPAEIARPLVDEVITELRRRGATVASGIFGAEMLVESANDGPLTLLVEVA